MSPSLGKREKKTTRKNTHNQFEDVVAAPSSEEKKKMS